MPKRSRVSLEDVADWNNLAEAAWLASKGKRDKRPVRAFMARLHENLSEMRREILAETIQVGQATTFVIHDPKQRTNSGPCVPRASVAPRFDAADRSNSRSVTGS